MPLIVTAKDLATITADPAFLDAAIDAVGQATIDYGQNAVRDAWITDKTTAADPNILQISFAAHDAAISGFQLFAEVDDGPEEPDGRFVVLLDPESRRLVGIVEYHSLGPLRVGASTAVAVRHLAPAQSRSVAIIGSGRQAKGQLLALARTLPDLQEARVYSPNAEHRSAFATEMAARLGLRVIPTETPRRAVEGADVVALAATSPDPVLESQWVRPGALVISIGGSRPPASLLGQWRIVSTTWDQLAARQPYRDAIQAGSFSQSDVTAELPAVLQGAQVRGAADETVIFECGRMNYWAVTVAKLAWEWALKAEIGTRFSLNES